MMDTKLLTLLTVVETKNFSLAAKRLNLTQPAVSQHIRSLEKEYDIRIFNRAGNDLKLTNEGETLVKYARKIDSLYDLMQDKIEDIKKKSTTLKVGVTHTAESTTIIDALARLSSEMSGTNIKIISDTIKNLYDKLSNYDIDFAVVEGKVRDKKFSSILVDNDSLLVVTSPDSPLAKKSSLNIKDVMKEKLILRSRGSATRSLFMDELDKKDLSLEDDFSVIMEIDNIATIKDLIRKGMGISILPKSVCYDEIKNNTLKVLPIEDMTMTREINIVYQKDSLDKELIGEILNKYRNLTR